MGPAGFSIIEKNQATICFDDVPAWKIRYNRMLRQQIGERKSVAGSAEGSLEEAVKYSTVLNPVS